ncbi:MAG: PilZ domain-containing protein [Candidatus Omnitrophica bacterium]|nr:PilZ domain-containing protein [Candidatus Omnitrophota bacterium]MDD5500388.1 PilZ domain-containing protein [Candidatus Omnitrophota bacterium]
MADNLQGKERRMSDRIDAAFTLTYSVEKSYTLHIRLGLVDNVDAVMLNLSDSGMAIITDYDIPKGAQLYIKFDLINMRLSGDDRWKSMKITGETVSSVKMKDENYRVGIRFMKISEEDRQSIGNFVFRNKIPSA